VQTIFGAKQIKFASAPQFKENFKIYEEFISIPSLTMEFVYNENFNDMFINYLKQYKDEITAVQLLKNDGTLLFSGNIDEDSDTTIDRERNTIKFSFIHHVAAYLDAVEPTFYRATGFYPSEEQYMAGNPDQIRPGEGALEELFTQIINQFLPAYSIEFPENWYEKQPLYVYFYEYLPTIYNGCVGAGLIVYWRDKTLTEILKLLCVLGFCRINIGANRTLNVISYMDLSTVEPDGELVMISDKTYRKDQIEYSLDGMELVKPRRLIEFEELFIPCVGPSSTGFVQSFYDDHSLLSYVTAFFSGLNSNLRCGDRFYYNGKNYLITEFKKDSEMIDMEYHSIDLQAIEVYNV
jgi:hypothetical protein